MSSRKSGYITGVVLMAIFFSLPMVLISIRFARALTVGGGLMQLLPLTPGLGMTKTYPNMMVSGSVFWRDELIYCNGTFWVFGDGQPQIISVNPETGQTTRIELKLAKRQYSQPIVFGDRLWWKGSTVFEVVDGAAQPSDFVWPTTVHRDGNRFLWKGEPAVVDFSRTFKKWTVSTFQQGLWQEIGLVVLPRNDQRDGVESADTDVVGIECHNRADRIDLFLERDDCLYYRNGLELAPLPSESVAAAEQPAPTVIESLADSPAAGWSLICRRFVKPTKPVVPQTGVSSKKTFWGMLVEGQPAVLFFDDLKSNEPIGHIYRFDGQNWTELASQQFPLGSHDFRVFTTTDGQRSYLGASTSIGAANVYAVEATSIRKTNASQESLFGIRATLREIVIMPLILLFIGLIFGAGTWLLMWWYTNPAYEFGLQTVRLASLGRRGCARLFDLGLIGVTTVGLGWLMTIGIDWQSFGEALNLHVDHPAIPVALCAVAAMAVWLIVFAFALLIVQAVWGLTPGKWLCRLRTVRTSLKPCGFARSLAREIVFFVDCGNFHCWTPGIVSIAFTDQRQRLGDLVADTIVIDSRSLPTESIALAQAS